MSKTLYLSGAISNDSDYKEKFEHWEGKLKQAGYKVFNPVKQVEYIQSKATRELSHEDCMLVCLQAMSDWRLCGAFDDAYTEIVKNFHGVAVIETEHESNGRDIEIEVAKIIGMEVKTVDEWLAEGEE